MLIHDYRFWQAIPDKLYKISTNLLLFKIIFQTQTEDIAVCIKIVLDIVT